MLDEDRLLEQFEPACRRYTRGICLPGMDEDDLLQEARIAAAIGVRNHRAGAGRSLTSYVIQCIRYRMGRLIRTASYQKRDWRVEADMWSLDYEIPGLALDGEPVLCADTVPAPNPQPGRDLLAACMQLCETEAERAIIASIWDDESLAEAGRWVGLSRERMRQLRDRLMKRIRRGVMAT
jgi:RNA polymerase sigma factor (sigma-70 family)